MLKRNSAYFKVCYKKDYTVGSGDVSNEHTMKLTKKLDVLYQKIEEEGLDSIFSNYFTKCERFLDLPRKEDVLAAINRMRNVTFL